jgi:hypothetical protein
MMILLLELYKSVNQETSSIINELITLGNLRLKVNKDEMIQMDERQINRLTSLIKGNLV